MRNAIRLCWVLAVAVVSGACFYEATAPLAPATQATDSTLFGTWIAPESEDSSRILIFGFDERTYFIRYTDNSSVDDPDDECCIYLHAHLTQVAGVHFLNTRVIGEPRPKWMFFRFERTGETIRVRGLKQDSIPKSLDSAGLNAYLTAHLNDPAIYEDWLTLKRVRGMPK